MSRNRDLTRRRRPAGNRRLVALLGLAAVWASAHAVPDITPAELVRLLPTNGEAIDNFGLAVAIDGDVAVIGAQGDDDQALNAGAAYVYHRVGNAWVEVQKLHAGNAAEGDAFGSGVAVQGNTIVVGAAFSNRGDFDTGSAYVFTRTGGTWIERTELIASDAGFRDLFGDDIAMDGGSVVIGAHGVLSTGNAGAAYVFTGSGANWSEEVKLTASDGVADDLFGIAVDIDQDTVIVGARYDDDYGTNSGSAYVFFRTIQGWLPQDKLNATDSTIGDQFGSSVAIDGDLIIVGSPNHDMPDPESGAAYLFSRSGSEWSVVQKLESTIAGAAGAGTSVGLSGANAIVGARFADRAFVYRQYGSSWEAVGEIVPSVTGSSTFASTLGYDGLRVVAGAFGDTDNGNQSGSAGIFLVDNFAGLAVMDQGSADGPGLAITDPDTTRARFLAVDGADGATTTDRTVGGPGLWPTDFVALPDVTFDGISEFALIARDPSADEVQALIRDGATGLFVGKILFSSDYRTLNAILLSGTGGPGTWGLGVHGVTVTGSQRVQVKDLSSGSLVANVDFSAKTVPFGAAAIADVNDNGVDDIVVLSTQSGDRSRAQIKDGLTKESLRILFFSGQYEPVDFGVVPDVDGGGEPEIALLGRRTSDDEVRLLLKDSVTGALVKNRRFDSAYEPVAYVYVPEAGAGPALGVLGRAVDGKVRLTLQDAQSGAFLRHISFNKAYLPREVEVLTDTDASGADEVAVLGVDTTGQAHLQIKDSLTGANIVERDLP